MRDDEGRSRRFARQLRKQLTDAETILWSRLRYVPHHKFRRQHPIGIYAAHFACVAAKLVVELDGATHGTEEEQSHDIAREAFMRERGWHTIRFPNQDIYKHLDDVLDAILRLTNQRTTERRR
jgi:very-short-patch-repair endonuclease